MIWHAADNDNYQWWNIGGWGNTATRAEASDDGARTSYGPSNDFTVETGRWYDLRLEVTGRRMRGFIDDKLVTDTTYDGSQPSSPPVYASATYDKSSHTAFVKVVNSGAMPVAATINIEGVRSIEPNATAIVLAGKPGDENTLDEPKKIAPQSETVSDASKSFRREFPPHSFTILQLKTSQ